MTSRAAVLPQELSERNAHAPLLSKKPLAAAERPKFHVVLKEHHNVVPVDDEEIRLLSPCDRTLGLPAHTIDGQEDASGELRLPFDLFTKDVQISHRAWVLLPFGLKQIHLVIKFKGSINLLANDAEGLSRREIMQGEKPVQHLLELETGLMAVRAFVESQELPLELLQVDAPLRSLTLAKSFGGL